MKDRLFFWVLILRSYFPGGVYGKEPLGSQPDVKIIYTHSLGCGLQGYLILFATHTFVSQRQ